jgi:endonuclease/exonuclease/phosphatase (EEP) superfamily protein YafD
MRLWRILAIATTAELAVLCAFMGVAGVAGAWSETLDLANVLAPVWLACGLMAAALAPVLLHPCRARRLIVGLGLVGALASGSRIAVEVAGGVAQPKAPMEASAFKVLTLNAWQNNVAPEATLAAILAAGPDAVMIQEWRGPFARVLPALEAAYPTRTRCRGRAGDLIILSRLPGRAAGCLGEVGSRRSPEDIEAVWLTLDLPGGGAATLVTTHLGWPVPPGRQVRQSAALAAFVSRFDSEGLILAGDFNTVPWTYAMGRQDRRLQPLVRRTRGFPTWPARLPRLEATFPVPFLPIDHIYASSTWRSAAITRVKTSGSDHYGVLAILTR